MSCEMARQDIVVIGQHGHINERASNMSGLVSNKKAIDGALMPDKVAPAIIAMP